jgi:hypothetical protein
MKNNFKTYTFLHFSVLCCFIVSIYSTAILTSYQNSLPAPGRSGENCYSVASSNLSFPISKSENIVYGADGFSACPEKQTFNDFSFTCKEAEILLFCSFLKNLNFSERIVLPFKSTDIIYPFHYFW